VYIHHVPHIHQIPHTYAYIYTYIYVYVYTYLYYRVTHDTGVVDSLDVSLHIYQYLYIAYINTNKQTRKYIYAHVTM